MKDDDLNGVMILYNIGKYTCLTTDECIEVALFFDDYNPSRLAGMIRRNDEMSDGMRFFIADVLDGKHPRPKGKKRTTLLRDGPIYNAMKIALAGGMPLRSNVNEEGAAAMIGDHLGLDEETIIKAYQRMRKIIEPATGR